jgi:murein DD-endopeptidase MepM/ murein hydrolase activator NlpD
MGKIAALIVAVAGVAALAGTGAAPQAGGNLAAEAANQAEGAFVWPVAPPAVLARPFEAPGQPWLAGHRGVDLEVGVGGAVLAPAAGTITYAGWIVDRPVLVISHGVRRSTLEPVAGAAPVGTQVRQGQQVGTLTADAAHCPGCLHWGVRRGEEYLDPVALVRPPVRAVLWE